MAWNPFNPLARLLLYASQEKERMQRRPLIPRRPPRFLPVQRKLLEVLVGVALLLTVILCGCCEPFRLWLLTVVHWLALQFGG
jgi:hypothetical protein